MKPTRAFQGSLQNLFKIKHDSVLLDVKGFEDFFKNGGWDDFYHMYLNSSGYITLSRVGFDKKLTKAILYKSTGCGSLCGAGDYIHFEKTDGRKATVRSHATDSDPELREPFSAAPRDCVKDRGHDAQWGRAHRRPSIPTTVRG